MKQKKKILKKQETVAAKPKHEKAVPVVEQKELIVTAEPHPETVVLCTTCEMLLKALKLSPDSLPAQLEYKRHFIAEHRK